MSCDVFIISHHHVNTRENKEGKLKFRRKFQSFGGGEKTSSAAENHEGSFLKRDLTVTQCLKHFAQRFIDFSLLSVPLSPSLGKSREKKGTSVLVSFRHCWCLFSASTFVWWLWLLFCGKTSTQYLKCIRWSMWMAFHLFDNHILSSCGLHFTSYRKS